MSAARRSGAAARPRIRGAEVVILAAGLVAGAGACATGDARAPAGGRNATGTPAASANGPAVGRPAPEITVDRLDGKKLALSSLRGKVVLLDVWASWCVPCVKELPMLDEMARRLRVKGVEVVAVSIDQERDNVVKFLDSQPRWALTVAHDPGGAIAETLQPDTMPTSYAIDRSGIIRYINKGFQPADAAHIERKLTELAEGSRP